MQAPLIDLGFDGHTHSHFCPHGSGEPLEAYLEQAVAVKLRRLAVTEHMPLPVGFVDPMGELQCAGPWSEWPGYLACVEQARATYADRLDVLVGAEIDWLGSAQGGWHDATLDALATFHERLHPDATLLSVHFVAGGIVDGTPELALAVAGPGQSADAYHLAYYAALEAALKASWRRGRRDLRPRRIGHLTLPRKFIRRLPLDNPARVEEAALRVLDRIAAEGLQLDFNVAGLDKPDCGETYLPEPLLYAAMQAGVELVYGSDAHHPQRVGQHRDAVSTALAPYSAPGASTA